MAVNPGSVTLVLMLWVGQCTLVTTNGGIESCPSTNTVLRLLSPECKKDLEQKGELFCKPIFQANALLSGSPTKIFDNLPLFCDGRDVYLSYDLQEVFTQGVIGCCRPKFSEYCEPGEIKDALTGKVFETGRIHVGEDYNLSDECPPTFEYSFGHVPCEEIEQRGPAWGKVVLNPKCSFFGLANSNISKSLTELLRLLDSGAESLSVLNQTIEIVRNSYLNKQDVLLITNILENSARTEQSQKGAKDILEIAGIVMEQDDTTLAGSQTRGNAVSRIIREVDGVGDRLKLSANGSVRVDTNKVGLEVWNLSAFQDVPSIGLKLQESKGSSRTRQQELVTVSDESDVINEATEAAIVFSKELVQAIHKEHRGRDIRLSLQVFKDTKLFTTINNTDNYPPKYILNSKVISGKLLVGGRQVNDLKEFEVNTAFLPIKKLPEDLKERYSACGFWNFSMNGGRGAWSTEGCRYSKGPLGRDTCACNHLTNFAILMDFYGQDFVLSEGHQLALTVISIIGLSLSVTGLSLTILSFFIIRKLRQSRPQQTLFNLAVAQLCAWIVFLAGIEQTSNEGGCIVVAILLHYFIMASFMWMLMEAVLHYLLFVKVLGTEYSRYMLKTVMLAWGLPTIPVIVVLSIDVNLYRGGRKYCWMKTVALYYAFALPVGLIILANFIVYIQVLVSLCRRAGVGPETGQSKRKMTSVNIRASAILFVLLGLSWIFGFLTVADARITFQYIFTITNSIQGFLIFALFTLRDKQVRDYWTAVCCRKKAAFSPFSSSGKVPSGPTSETKI